jgi:hypothetical protein
MRRNHGRFRMHLAYREDPAQEFTVAFDLTQEGGESPLELEDVAASGPYLEWARAHSAPGYDAGAEAERVASLWVDTFAHTIRYQDFRLGRVETGEYTVTVERVEG